jgi:hypothetical protein
MSWLFVSAYPRAQTCPLERDPNDLTNASGRLPNDRPHILRLTGLGHLPWGFLVAANLQHFSGAEASVRCKDEDEHDRCQCCPVQWAAPAILSENDYGTTTVISFEGALVPKALAARMRTK